MPASWRRGSSRCRPLSAPADAVARRFARATDRRGENRHRSRKPRASRLTRARTSHYTEPSRNPFRFGERRQVAAGRHHPLLAPPSVPIMPQAPPTATHHAGWHRRGHDGRAGTTHRHISNTDAGVVLAKEGDQVGGYRVEKIAADAVELVKIDDGSVRPRRAPLDPERAAPPESLSPSAISSSTTAGFPRSRRRSPRRRRCRPARPSAKLAMLTPCLPRIVPMSPMTPGWSVFRITIIVPSSGASTPMPSSSTSRGRRPFEDRAFDPALAHRACGASPRAGSCNCASGCCATR